MQWGEGHGFWPPKDRIAGSEAQLQMCLPQTLDSKSVVSTTLASSAALLKEGWAMLEYSLLEAPSHLLPAVQALPPPATSFLSGSLSALLNCWLLSEHALHSSPLSRPCLVHQSLRKGLPFISIEARRNLPSFQRLV